MGAFETVVDAALSDGVRVRTVVTAENAWFEGHFPSDPLLPGIAMLALVEDTLRVFAASPVDVAVFHRLRFRHILRPGAPLLATVRKAKTEGAFEFVVDADGTLACSGTCMV